jgi:hypothetical protein
VKVQVNGVFHLYASLFLEVTNTLTLCFLCAAYVHAREHTLYIVERTGIDAWIQYTGSVHGIVLALCLL